MVPEPGSLFLMSMGLVALVNSFAVFPSSAISAKQSVPPFSYLSATIGQHSVGLLRARAPRR